MPKSKLATVLAAPPPHGKSRTECRVIVVAAELSPADRKLFMAAVQDARWRHNVLSESLKRGGVSVSAASINKHRTGTCVCATSQEAQK